MEFCASVNNLVFEIEVASSNSWMAEEIGLSSGENQLPLVGETSHSRIYPEWGSNLSSESRCDP